MVAYVDSGVFIQMWVGAEDKLPRLVRAIFLDDPERLRYELAFSDWKLDETVPAGHIYAIERRHRKAHCICKSQCGTGGGRQTLGKAQVR